MQLSIVICTHNRSGLLDHCLMSLENQNWSKEEYEVIIVDNNSTDNTKQLVKSYLGRNKNFFYYLETKQGLGYARNRGLDEARAAWVAFVDDDGKAFPNYVERALWVIGNCTFDAFGGVYNAWHTLPKPKWLSDDFGTNRMKQRNLGVLEKDFMDGGNMVWHRKSLKQLGGFHTEIGMVGNKISYGEETYVQIRAKERGLIIGFDPELQIDHYVQPYKLKLSWHLKSYYAVGKDYWKTFNRIPDKKSASSWNYQYLVRRILSDFITNSWKPLFKRNYYWQNLLLGVLQVHLIELGKINSAKKLYKHPMSKL